ncbi:MAG: TIGR02757 family protein [Saprospiraceae bacterium]
MSEIKLFLDAELMEANTRDFIAEDPVALPHAMQTLQDREIIGFWAATIAWGQRRTIIANALLALEYMDGAPYDFVRGHSERERERFAHYRHRTFQPEDARYFLRRLQAHYLVSDSLENAFTRHLAPGDADVEPALRGFHDYFFALPDAPERTRKHVATPARGSSCKRLNMFLRWMVRRDAGGVDMGLWRGISSSQLCIPLDVHVERAARMLGLLTRSQTDWKAVQELTARLRDFDPLDPIKYDLALFSISRKLRNARNNSPEMK